MAFDDDHDPERLPPNLPSPDDRLWRHPSELAGGTPPPSAWLTPATRPAPKRGMAAATLASACLLGAAVAMGVMWFTRPSDPPERSSGPIGEPVTTAAFSSAEVPSKALAEQVTPALVTVESGRNDQWTSGTGLWLDDAGTIAVATSLVADADQVMVTDTRGERVHAAYVGADDATGMSIYAVDLGDAPSTAVAGDHAQPATGDPVVVVGAAAPAGGAGSQRVMTARVSAVGVRTTVDPTVLHDAVQLDRAVPVDALGGLVVDADGHLVGIVIAPSGEGRLAVVLPADEALTAARAVRDHGSVHRAWLGVRSVDLSPEAAEMMDISGGALLKQVQQGSPADAAGLEAGDAITDVDGTPIRDASDLVVVLRTWSPGEQVRVTYHRGMTTGVARITLGG